MLINGLGVEKDTSRGFKWVLQAAEKGNMDAQYHVSIYYLNGVGVEKDLGKCAKWRRAAAEKGHPEAQSIIGQLMFFGEGQKQDRQGAIRWLKMEWPNPNSFWVDVCFMEMVLRKIMLKPLSG